MRGKDLNVAPRKANQIRLELRGGIPDGLTPLRDGKQREIQNSLSDLRFPPMDKVRQVGDPDGIDLFAREKNIQNRVHYSVLISSRHEWRRFHR